MKKGTKIKTAFDEYTLVKQVGSGGNGRVFSATNESGIAVAIKFVERNISADKLKRLKNEIFFCEHHKHKNIVEILDRGCATIAETEYVFYVMPLYDDTLRNKMKIGLKPEQAVDVFIGIIEGLGYAHRNGAIHRDVKPENILFKSDSMVPVLCDFGIAHFAEEELLTVVETGKSDRMANFQYAAPEQRVKGGAVSGQTDVYAAALILNEMFTGEIPQASDYRTIASVVPEFKFLDDVFTLLFKQRASDRLYPSDKILTEIKVRSEEQILRQKISQLQSTVQGSPDMETFEANIIDKFFTNGRIIFTLDKELPFEWFQIMSGGHIGGYSAIVGYGPDKLEKEGRCAISMRVREGTSENTIRQIAGHVINWIPKANEAYTAYIKDMVQQKQREEEQMRKVEIERLEREISINSILAGI